MAVTHSTTVVVADDGTSPVGTDEWNAAHTTATVSLSGASANKDQLLIPDTTAGAGLTIGADTNLYRSAANTLKTDDSLVVAGAAGVLRTATSPGEAVPIQHFRADTFDTNWAFGLSSIYDAVQIDYYLGFNATLSGGTLAAPTFGANSTFGGVVLVAHPDDPSSLLRIGETAAGAAAALTIGLTIHADTGELDFGSAGDTNLYRSAANTLKTDDALVVAGTIKQSTTKDVLDTDHTAAADPHSTYFKTISFGGNLA